MKLAVFISGGGTTLRNLIKQQENRQLCERIGLQYTLPQLSQELLD